VPDLNYKEVLRAIPGVTNVRDVEADAVHARQVEAAKQFARLFSFTFTTCGDTNPQAHDLVMGLRALPLRHVPKFWFADPTQVATQPHVDFTGGICYVEDEFGVLVDVRNPEGVVGHALECVAALLEKNMNGDLAELYDEFESFWGFLPHSYEVASAVEEYSELEAIDCQCEQVKGRRGGQNILRILGSKPRKSFKPSAGFQKKLIEKKKACQIIPLAVPPAPPSMADGLTINYLRDVIASQPPDRVDRVRKALDRKFHRKKGGDFYLLFSFPSPDGLPTLFGIQLAGQSPVPLYVSHKDEKWFLRPFCVRRQTRRYLLTRGGGVPSLDDLVVAVVGCGSVGSQVVELLARSGVGTLVLVDPDLFSSDNLFRHTLGMEAIDQPKVLCLANRLRATLPGIKVKAFPSPREVWLQRDISAVDLIIDATADQTGALVFSEVVKDHGIPTVFTWLEPLGLGGHAVLVAPDIEGCLACYFDRAETGPYFRKQFLRHGERVLSNLTGCRGVFTPFTAVDASMTAALAVDTLLGYALRGERIPYRFWKGSAAQAREAGKQLSEWYESSESDQLFNHERAGFHITCQACRERNGRS
jgi:molybdopterin/thiamine biosynthesis adenylyltransferase